MKGIGPDRYGMTRDRFVATNGEIVLFIGDRRASLAFVCLRPPVREPSAPLNPLTSAAKTLHRVLGRWPHEIGACVSLAAEAPQVLGPGGVRGTWCGVKPDRLAAVREFLRHPDKAIRRSVVCLGAHVGEALGADLYEITRDPEIGSLVQIPAPTPGLRKYVGRAYEDPAQRDCAAAWLEWAQIVRRV